MASRCFDTKPLSLHPQNARTHTVTSRIGSSGRRLDKGATGVLCRFLSNKMKHQTNALGHRRARGWRAAAGLAMVATLLLAGSPTAGGKSIDPQRAALIAQRYVRLAGAGAAQAPARGVVPTSGAPYYLFNDARGNGFVVVAADDEMGEVLAYGTAGLWTRSMPTPA